MASAATAAAATPPEVAPTRDASQGNERARERRTNGSDAGRWFLALFSLAHRANLDLLVSEKLSVIVWLRATGDAPILKQQRYKVGANERFSKVVDLLRERLKKDSLVRVFSFYPSPFLLFPFDLFLPTLRLIIPFPSLFSVSLSLSSST